MIPTELLKAANAAQSDADYQRSVEKKFRTLAPHVARSGVYTGVTKRILIPKKVLTETDLRKHLGFVPDPLAIPEAGQKRLTSFRNPMHEYHLHDHGDVWAMHHDDHPAANMLVLRAKLEAAKSGTTAAPKKVSVFKMLREGAKGAPHALREGLPAYAAYLRGRIRREPGMREQIEKGLPKSYTRLVSSMEPSRYHAEEKVAASRGVKNIRKALEAGDLDEANRLARLYGQAGAIKDTPAGIQAYASRRKSNLGAGSEGRAMMVIDPKGIAARKMFFRGGQLDNANMRRHKAQFFRDMEGHPNVAKLYGEYEGSKGPMHKVEFIPGREARPGEGSSFRQDVVAQGERRGHKVQDVLTNPANSRITPKGKLVVVDPLTMPMTEYQAKRVAAPRFMNDILDIHYPHGLPHGADENVMDQLKRLGRGSRQAPKKRGAKGPGGAAALRARFNDRNKVDISHLLPPQSPIPPSAPQSAFKPPPTPAPSIPKPSPSSITGSTAARTSLAGASAVPSPSWKRRALVSAGGVALAGGLGMLAAHNYLRTKKKEKEKKGGGSPRLPPR